MHDNLYIVLQVKLANNQFSPNSISHRDLNILFNKAKKENSDTDTTPRSQESTNKEFNELILNWSETSQKILFMLKKKDELVSKNRNSKSVLALGAMGAHINMALQALKATEFNE